MEESCARALCRSVIRSAIQRCQSSETLCRLSVRAKCSLSSAPSVVQICVSDTGTGSNLMEFRSVDYAKDHHSAQKWDGILYMTTTSISDDRIYHFRLNVKENDTSQWFKRLASMPKSGSKFSGTEVSFCTEEDMEDLVSWIHQFCQKIVILRVPKVVIDLQVEYKDKGRSRRECLIQANQTVVPMLSEQHIGTLISRFVDYITRHGNILGEKCSACFSASNENMKTGSGLACSKDSIGNLGSTVEVVIAAQEVPIQATTLCLNASGSTTKVLYFQDFTPFPFPFASAKVLAGINWRSYGFTLHAYFIDVDGHAILEWDNLPCGHVDILVHAYHKVSSAFDYHVCCVPLLGTATSHASYAFKLKVVFGHCFWFEHLLNDPVGSLMYFWTNSPHQPVEQPDWKLLKRAVTLALDDLKSKYEVNFELLPLPTTDMQACSRPRKVSFWADFVIHRPRVPEGMWLSS